MSELLEIATLGGLSIRIGDQSVSGFASRKVEALLVYLACNRREHQREALAELLWEDQDQQRSSANLRMALTSLRKSLEPYILATRLSVTLNPDVQYWLDVSELEAQLDAAQAHSTPTTELSHLRATQLEKALALYRGEFLAGFSLSDNRDFEAWAGSERERLRRRVADALQRLVAWHLDCGAFHAGVQQATRLLQIDPLSEEAHRQMMLLLARTGQRHAALAQYARCQQQLADELGIEPTEMTRALYEQIRADKLGPSVPDTLNTGRALAPAENPYKGLYAFQEADAPDFFGREKVVQQLLGQLAPTEVKPTFLAVVGPSGSGKSSVVRAGLLPALRRGALPGSDHWALVEMIPGAHPLEELDKALRQVAVNPALDLKAQLRRDARGLIRVIPQVLPAKGEHCLLVIDQFEEVFALVEDEVVRSHFLDSLVAAVTEPGSQLSVLITLRADFYDRPLLYPGFGELVRNATELVLPLAPEELEQAIVAPAQRAGVVVAGELVTRLVADVNGQPGSLPLLQYALTELFERRDGQGMTLDAYRAIGGVPGAVTRRADDLYERLDQNGQSLVRQLFLRLVTLGEGVEYTRRRVHKQELLTLTSQPQPVELILDSFARHRLLTLDHEAVTDVPTVEVAHEALLRTWGRLKDWLRQSRDDLRMQRRLIAAVSEWLQSGRELSFLSSGVRLEQFEAWLRSTDLALNQAERAYLEASIAEGQRQRSAEQERQAREVRLERRSRNFRRGLVAVLLVATIGAVGLALVAQQNALRADHNAAESQTVALVSGSQAALANGNTDQAIAIALQAITLDPHSATAQAALSEAAYMPGTIRRFVGHTASVNSVALSPDGRTALSASDDKTVILWDMQTGKILHRFEGQSDKVRAVAFAPDGRSAISGGHDKTMIRWAVQTGKIIRHFEEQSGQVIALAISPDGLSVASGNSSANVILYDIETGKIIRRFEGHTGAIYSVKFSADGINLLTTSDDRTIILWDVGTGQKIRSFAGHTSWVTSAVFSPEHNTILSGSDDGTMILWDIKTGQITRRFTEFGNATVQQVAFSPDGRAIIEAGAAGIALVDTETAQTISHLYGHTGFVNAIVFSPDGRTLLSAAGDSTLRLWDLEEGQMIRRFNSGGAGDATSALAASADGHMAMAAVQVNSVSSVIVWDVDTGKEIHRYRADKNISDLAISPDGHTALLGTDEGNQPSDLILWDINTGTELRRFRGHPAGVVTVAFSPDGRMAASGDKKGVLILWDVLTGREIRHLTGYEGDAPDFSDVWEYVRFSPDGHSLVATHAKGIIVLWDVATGKEIRHFEGHSRDSRNFVFSADGQRAFTGSIDSTAILWDVGTGSILHRFRDHSGPIPRVDMTSDGHFGIAGSIDGTTTLWDLETGELIRRYHAEPYSLLFAPDNHTLLTNNYPARIELWRIDTTLDELLTWIHANRYIPDLTCDQRAFYRLEPLCTENAPLPSTGAG